MTDRSAPSTPAPGVPAPPRERREFARSFDSLEEIFAFVRGILDPRGVDAADAYAIVMAIEEFFTNMVKYNANGRGPIALEVQCSAGAVTCSLTDPDSDRFDVNAVPDANINLPAEQRRPGGLGIHLIRRMLDSIDYDHADRRSRITFRRTLARTLFRLADSIDSH